MNKERYQKYILKQRGLNKDKVCKFCKKQHDHTFGTGEFCSIECRAKYAAQKSKVSQKSIAHRRELVENGILRKKPSPHGTWKCNICGEILETRDQLKSHIENTHNIKKHIIKIENDVFKCPYCDYTGSKLQTIGHLRSCKSHPLKELHDQSCIKQGKTYSERIKSNIIKSTWLGKHLSKETREKLSKIRSEQMKNECLTNTYHKVKWYRVKNINNEEYVVRGMWEVNVSKRLNEIGLLWTKSKPIPYVEDGITHNYIPDFFIPSIDIYIEVKGGYPERDRMKMKLVHDQHPELKIYFIHKQYYQFINGEVEFNDNLLLTESDL